EFDEAHDRLQARRRTYWETLLLDEDPAPLPDATTTAAALAEAATERFARVFPPESEEAARFVARVRCLDQWMPELALPRLDDAALQQLLPTIALGRRSLDDLRHAPWLMHL